MHRDLKTLLHTAKGESRFVVVIFLDVRGFSSFARMAESSESAVFLKSAYITILDDYFPEASFFKPTGDGLLIILDYDEETLSDVVQHAVSTSIQLVRAFPTICERDPMVNFAVPGELGIGIARGAATRLISGDKTLDYSGRPLNLAARLMDLARPSGVVYSGSLTVDSADHSSPDRATRDPFTAESVYIKGLAEDDPMEVFCLADSVLISDVNRSPLNRLDRKVEKPQKMTLRQMRESTSYLFPLSADPAKRNDIKVHVDYPVKVSSGRTLTRTVMFDAAFEERAGVKYALLRYGPMVELLRKQKVTLASEVGLVVEYPIWPRSSPDQNN